MTSPIVRLDYQALARLGSRFRAQAEQAQDLVRRLRRQMDVLEGGDWVGAGATAFYAEMNQEVLPALDRLVRALQAAHSLAEQISRVFRETEGLLAALFRALRLLGGGAAEATSPGGAAGPGAGAGASGGGLGDWVKDLLGSAVGGSMLGPLGPMADRVGSLFGVGPIASEIGRGMVDEAGDMLGGLWHVATDPVGTIQGLAYGVTHPGELWEGLKRPYVEAWESGHPGRAIGRGVLAVGTLFIPGAGEAGAAAEAAGAAGRVGRVAELAGAAGRAGEIADVARLGEAAEAARLSEAARAGRAGELAGASRAADAAEAARVARGEEVFAELGQELGLSRSGAGGSSAAAAASDAQAAGLMRGIEPGAVDLAVQSHSTAPTVRQILGITGEEAQSAHIAPTAALEGTSGYSRGGALTTLLEPEVHAALDAHWKDWAIQLRRQGRTDITAGELYQEMSQAIRSTPDLGVRTQGALEWRLHQELFRDMGLQWTDNVRLPYPNIKPVVP